MHSIIKRLRINRLAVQCMLAAAVVTVLPLILMSTIVGSHVGRTLQSLSQAEAELALHELQQVTETKIKSRRLDLLTLATSPPIRDIDQAQTNKRSDAGAPDTLKQAYARLADLFAKYMIIHDGTHQLRYLNADGEEIVRVDWEDGRMGKPSGSQTGTYKTRADEAISTRPRPSRPASATSPQSR